MGPVLISFVNVAITNYFTFTDIQNQVFWGNKITRLYNENDHITLTSLTSEIAKAVNLPESFLGYKIIDVESKIEIMPNERAKVHSDIYCLPIE